MKIRRLISSSIAIFAAQCVAARAGIDVEAFSNFGPNSTFANGGTWFGLGPSSTAMFSATSFTPTITGQLKHVDLAVGISSNTPVPNQVTLSLLSGVGSAPPASTRMWSETFQDKLSVNQGLAARYTSFDLNNAPLLSAGVRYWFYVESPLAGFTSYVWQDGLEGVNPYAWYYQTPTDPYWQVFDPTTSHGRSLRVLVTVPELCAASFLLITVGIFQRRRTTDGSAPRGVLS